MDVPVQELMGHRAALVSVLAHWESGSRFHTSDSLPMSEGIATDARSIPDGNAGGGPSWEPETPQIIWAGKVRTRPGRPLPGNIPCELSSAVQNHSGNASCWWSPA